MSELLMPAPKPVPDIRARMFMEPRDPLEPVSREASLAFNRILESEFFLLLSFLEVALDYLVSLERSDGAL